MLLDVHWLTDVIGGLALGWAWFALCAIAFGGRLLRFGARRRGRRGRASEPDASAPTASAGRGASHRASAPGHRARSRGSPSDAAIPIPPASEELAAGPAPRADGARGALVRDPGEPPDLRSPPPAAAPDRLGARSRSAARRLGRDADPPPRPGNALEVLIDGARRSGDRGGDAGGALARPSDRLVLHAVLRARCATATRLVLRDLLAELAERVDVRVLAWAGAPLPLFRPSRGDVRQMRDRLSTHSRIQVALDAHERPMHCHHEKTIVIDDRVAFVGGIDLTSEAGDRFDTPHHPARAAVGWHDVAARIEGPAVADVAEHFTMRWHEVTGERLARAGAAPSRPATSSCRSSARCPRRSTGRCRTATSASSSRTSAPSAAPSGSSTSRTSSSGRPRSPRSSPTSSRTRRRPIPDSRRAARRGRTAAPTTPAACWASCSKPTPDAGRVFASTIYARAGRRADPIYVHAKVGIVDDDWLTIGSANLNEHSLFNDTEMNVVTHDPASRARRGSGSGRSISSSRSTSSTATRPR